MVCLTNLCIALVAPQFALVTALQSAVLSSAECRLVNFVVNGLRAVPTATPFCSSFLHIPTITTTKTVTAVSVIPITTTKTTATTTLTVGTITVVTQTVFSASYTGTSTSTVVSGIFTTPKYGKCTLPALFTIVLTLLGNSVCGGPTSLNGKARRTALPGTLAGVASAQLSTACRCLGIPTPTKTVTTSATITSTSISVVSAQATVFTTSVGGTRTTTVTLVYSTSTSTTITTSSTFIITPTRCPAPPDCGNQGLQFAVYPNTDGPDTSAGYGNFDPQGYKTVTPEYEGVTSSIGVDSPGLDPRTFTIYDQYTREVENYVLNHRGYIFAAETGPYTFAFYDIDDIIDLWIGDTAFSGWTRANSDIDTGGTTNYKFTVSLVMGHYYAIRIVFGRATGNIGGFIMNLTAADGTDLNRGSSPFLVQYPCFGAAPEYPPFGSET